MRPTWLVFLVAGLLAGCGAQPGAPTTSPAVSRCTTGYANQIDIQLGVRDNGRSITAHLCSAIDVLLVGPPAAQWQSIESSDESVLSVVPLPLPHPPPGGANLVYLAERTGSAMLSSVGSTVACPSPGAFCRGARWSVSVKVVA